MRTSVPPRPTGRFRRRLALSALTFATIGIFFGYTVGGIGHSKLNQELAFAYELHLNTVRDLIEYARAHAIPTQPVDLDQVIAQAAAARPNVRSHRDFHQFESAQGVVATFARDLIATMDGELGPRDEGFAKLIRRFDAEERSLDRIRRQRRPLARLLSLTARRDERL